MFVVYQFAWCGLMRDVFLVSLLGSYVFQLVRCLSPSCCLWVSVLAGAVAGLGGFRRLGGVDAVACLPATVEIAGP